MKPSRQVNRATRITPGPGPVIEKIKLNKKEQKLFDAIQWEFPDTIRGGEWPKDNCENIGQLAESLIKREAIPKLRRRMFDDPDLNPGGYGKSRLQGFRNNGNSDSEILRHAHFMPWLSYFILGPDLPEPTIQGFLKIIEDDDGLEINVVDQLKKYVRKETRAMGRDNHAEQEFFRLCHEAGKPQWAEFVRKAAMEASRR
jgi:hypothetical protein